MNLSFPIHNLPPEAEALRAEVRAFLRDEIAAGHWQRRGDFGTAHDPAFSARLGARGWIGMTWPAEWGGRQRSMLERLVVTEELIAANAPMAAHWISDRQSGPLLLRYGSPEQRRRFLPAIVRGECFFSIGMSEPDAGSDLAAARTRATRCAGGWRINGRKVWTSFAHRNHFAIVLTRTGDAGPSRHEGLSQFIVDLKSPGVQIRPILNLAGNHEFNEVTFDDAFVPDEALVGEPGNGWHQVTGELAFERSGPERYLSCMRIVEAVIAVGRASGGTSGAVRAALGRLSAKLIALRAMSLSVAASLQNGALPNLEASLIKDLGNSFEREQVEIFRRLLADIPDPGSELLDAFSEATLHAPSWSLRGGAREVLRGVVARGLGLR